MSDVLSTLQLCSEKLLGLGTRVENLRRLSSSSEVFKDLIAPPPSPAELSTSESTLSSMPVDRVSPRCHECHGPITNYHSRYPHGIGNCPLQHYDLCPGNISEGKDRGGHLWRGCPNGYVPPGPQSLVPDNPEDGSIKSPSDFSYTSLNSLDQTFAPSREVSPSGHGRPHTRSLGEGAHLGSLLTESPNNGGSKTPKQKPTNLVPSPTQTSLGTDSVFPPQPKGHLKEDLLLEAELAELALVEERLEKLKKVREKKKKLEEDFDRLSRQSHGEGAKKKVEVHEAVDRMRGENRSERQSRREASNYHGPTMEDIRRDTSTKDEVENLMGEVREIPALSRAANTQRFGQPVLKTPAPPVTPQRHRQQRFSSFSPAGKSQHVSLGSRSRCSEILYRWETGVDKYGVEYKTLVEVTPEKSKATSIQSVVPVEDGWVYDPELGRAYRRTVLSQERYRPSSTPPRHGRPTLRSPVRYQRAHSGTDWYPSRVSQDRHLQPEREGKPVTIVDHARQLPLECSRSITSKNVDFSMFMYGAIKEIHSARIGTAPPLESGLLEAKLQHLLNVIHVTCLNMNSTDFKPVAWSVGRTYHYLVQSKVDSGRESWLDFDQLHRGSPHASEMVAAEREHRVALANQLKPSKDVKKGDKKDDKKPLCSSWNNSEVEGKCKWETEHPDSKCNRSHHCSYCEKKSGNTRTNHQARFCKRKQDEDK